MLIGGQQHDWALVVSEAQESYNVMVHSVVYSPLSDLWGVGPAAWQRAVVKTQASRAY